MSKKASFVLYHDLRGPLELLTDQDRGKLFLSLFDYSEFGILPQFDGALRMAFAFVRASIDRDSERWEEKSKARATAGRSGGLATQAKVKHSGRANQASASFAEQNEQPRANQAVPVPVPIPAPVPDNLPSLSKREGSALAAGKPPRSRFIPPTADEVSAYCKEKGYCIDPNCFVNFYTANGWKQGKGKPIVDWKAAVRTWEQRDKPTDSKGVTSYSDVV